MPPPGTELRRWPLFILSSIIACVMAFGIGGNDSANSWGTSVGSGAISLRTACMLGGICEFLGATFLGAGVSKTIQKGVAPIDGESCWACGFCDSKMVMYQYGMFASLCGAAFFLLLVTFFSMPVSTTHAIVGGVVGMTWAAVGWDCLKWKWDLTKIVASWVISPLFAGIVGALMYVVTFYTIMKAARPVRNALVAIPFLYGLTSGTMLFLILLKSNLTKTNVSASMRSISSLAAFVVVTALTGLILVPRLRRQLSEEGTGEDVWELEGDDHSDEDESSEEDDARNMMQSSKPRGLRLCTADAPNESHVIAKKAFRMLLVFVAAMESFAHGANDTANATGPYGALWNTHTEGIYACNSPDTPWYIMAAAGFFVFLGINIMGYRVIQTIGTDIAKIDFHTAYCVEFASTTSVVVATLIGLPVSTTHCQVGAIVFIGALSQGREGVNLGLFGKIGLAWLATLPAAGGLAAFLTWWRFFT